MNYELAKQLKDVGFPQSFEDCDGSFKCACDIPELRDKEGYHCKKSQVYIPTLEELIEACGEVKKIIFENQIDGSKTIVVDNRGYGPHSSFVECIANLWLAINKK